jgi:hypothetical protein
MNCSESYIGYDEEEGLIRNIMNIPDGDRVFWLVQHSDDGYHWVESGLANGLSELNRKMWKDTGVSGFLMEDDALHCLRHVKEKYKDLKLQFRVIKVESRLSVTEIQRA